MSDYIKYQHVEKFGSDEVDGLELGTCYVFPKIDGTNANVWWEDGELHCGSRNRELTIDNDNAGFMAWAVKQDGLMQLAIGLEGKHIYGEWLVPHSLKTYAESAWRNFYVFDVFDPIDRCHIAYENYSSICDDCGVEYIAPLRILKNPKIEDIEKCLDENKYLIKNGEGIGEGVVVKNYEFVNKFGRQTWAKMVTSEFKEKHHKEMGAPISACSEYVEELMVNKYLTPCIIEKAYANIKASGGWDSRKIPQLLGVVYYDFVRECLWDALKQFKNPTVDFKRLQKFTHRKVKQEMPQLF